MGGSDHASPGEYALAFAREFCRFAAHSKVEHDLLMPRRLAAALVCLVLPLSAPHESQSSLLRLPVRVHLLHSTESVLLSSTYTEQDVKNLLATVNVVWRPAGIVWELESIVRDEAPLGAQFDSVVNGSLKIGTTCNTPTVA